MKRLKLRTKLIITIIITLFIILGGLYNKKAQQVEAAWESYNVARNR